MKIMIIFVLLLVYVGDSITIPIQYTVTKNCGFPVLTDVNQKHTVQGDAFICMKKIEINSKTYGTKYVLVDDEDYELVSKYTWNLGKVSHGKVDKFYAIHSFNKGVDETGRYRFSSFKMHRLIFGFPKDRIDHKDNDGLNNQRSNLRIATPSQNSANSVISKNNTSGYKGVTYRKDADRYATRIRVNDKLICCGHFKDPKDAAKKYNEMAIKHFGEYAKLNII